MPVARTGLRELDLRGLDDASACTALMAQACDPEHASRERILVEALGNLLAPVELPVVLDALKATEVDDRFRQAPRRFTRP